MPGASGKEPSPKIEGAKKLSDRVRTFLTPLLEVITSNQLRLLSRRKRSDQLIGALAMAALESWEVDRVLTCSLQEVLRAIRAKAGMIYLAEEDQERAAMVAHKGLPEEAVQEMSSVLRGEGLIGRIFRGNKSLIVSDLRIVSCRGTENWVSYGYRSFVGAPISHGGKVLGVVVLLSKLSRTFARSDCRRLGSAGCIIGAALDRAHAYEEIRTALVTMRRLKRVDLQPGLSRNVEEGLEKLAQAVCEATLSLSSMIVLLDGQGNVVHRAAFGYPRRALSATPRLDAAAARALRSRECLLFSAPDEIRVSIGPEVLEAGFGSCICLPLHVAHKPLGALWLSYEAPRRFVAWEIEQVQALADQVGAAIHDVQAHAAVLERIERWKALVECCARISSTANLQGVLQALVDSARELLGAETAIVSLTGREPVGQAISMVAQAERGKNDELRDLSPVKGSGVLFDGGSGLSPSPATGIPERMRVVSACPEFAPGTSSTVSIHRMRGSLAVRLVDDENKPVGLLMVGDRVRGGDFTEEDAELLEALARHGIVAILSTKAGLKTGRLVEGCHSLLDQVPVATAFLNQEQTITAVNRAFEELSGFTREEIEGKVRLCDLLPEAERECSAFSGEQGGNASVGRRSETTLVTKNGERKRVRAFVGTSHDGGTVTVSLTELDQREEEATRKEREESASHGIALGALAVMQEALATAAGHVEKLIRKQWPEEALESICAISEAIVACRQTVEAFAILAECRAPGKDLFSMNDLMTGLADEKAEKLRRDGIGVVLRLEANLPAVEGDVEKLRWVLGTLIENCRRAMRESEEDRTLTIRTERSGSSGRTIISDTKRRMPPGSLESLFELPKFDRGNAEGADLSLAACRAVIERHGWEISAQRPAEGGLAFVMKYAVSEKASGEKQEEPAHPDVETPPGRPQAEAVRRVLVVDDEGVVIDLLDYYLRSEGLSVEVSRDGRSALKKLKEEDYDLIFCDLKLPGLSGQDLYRWLEANKPDMARRVIFITGDVATPETRAFLNSPRKRWLEKPFELTELRQMITEALR